MFSVSFQDERDIVSGAKNGSYVVSKANCIARFEFNNQLDSQSSRIAQESVISFISKRKDKEMLRVQIVEFV